MSAPAANEIYVPNWITTDFINSVLVAYKNDVNLKVVNLVISSATGKNDNYASVMFRAEVTYNTTENGVAQETMSLIIKTVPENESKVHELISMSPVFTTEIRMYTETIPRIQEILRAHGDATELAPKILYSALTPNKVIIMEDLCKRGYDVVRDRWLNENEVEAIHRKLAKLHAVSYMLGQSEEHEIVTSYQKGMLSTSVAFEHPLIAGGMKKFLEMLSTYDEFASYVPKFQAVQAELLESCRQLFNAYQNGRKDEIFVLNHGDFHMKNLMVKLKDANEVDDVLLVDLQICTFAPSIIDLTYSAYAILSPDLRHKRDVFWHYYWDEFIATLKLIKYEGELPTFGALKIASIKYRHFAIFMLATFVPMISFVANNSLGEVDVAAYFEDPAQNSKAYHSRIFIEEVRRLLPVFLHDGFLD